MFTCSDFTGFPGYREFMSIGFFLSKIAKNRLKHKSVRLEKKGLNQSFSFLFEGKSCQNIHVSYEIHALQQTLIQST